MSSTLSIIAGLIALLRWWIERLELKRQIDGATAQAILKGLRDSDASIERAIKARDLVRAEHQRDPASVMHDDEFRRKGD